MDIAQEYPPVLNTRTELPKTPPEKPYLPRTGLDSFVFVSIAIFAIILGILMVRNRW